MGYQTVLNDSNNYADFLSEPTKIDFALKEACDYLKSVDLANDSIISRSLGTLGFVISAMTALIIHSLSSGISGLIEPIKLASLIAASLLYVIAAKLVANLKTASVSGAGNKPDNLINQKTCLKSFKLEDIKIILINNTQISIDKLEAENIKKSKNLNHCIKFLVVAPWVYMLIFALTNFVISGILKSVLQTSQGLLV